MGDFGVHRGPRPGGSWVDSPVVGHLSQNWLKKTAVGTSKVVESNFLGGSRFELVSGSPFQRLMDCFWRCFRNQVETIRLLRCRLQ